MADAPNWAEITNALASIVTAGAALWAAQTWRHTLHHQRIDECFIAIQEVRLAFKNCMTLLKENDVGEAATKAYDELLKSWRDLTKALVVVQRYNKKLHHAARVHLYSSLIIFDMSCLQLLLVRLARGKLDDGAIASARKNEEDVMKLLDEVEVMIKGN